MADVSIRSDSTSLTLLMSQHTLREVNYTSYIRGREVDAAHATVTHAAEKARHATEDLFS